MENVTSITEEYNITESLILSTIMPMISTTDKPNTYETISTTTTATTTTKNVIRNTVTSGLAFIQYLTTTQLPENTTMSGGAEYYQGSHNLQHLPLPPEEHPHKHPPPFAPGRMEAIVIVSIVCTILFLAAKYVGCKLSYCPCYKTFSKCCKSSSSSSTTHTRPVHYQRTLHTVDSARYQQEYNTDMAYAAYARPTTAYGIQSNLPSAGGYTYGLSTDGGVRISDEMIMYEKEKADQPPEYDSIVPPTFDIANRQTYSYSATSKRHY